MGPDEPGFHLGDIGIAYKGHPVACIPDLLQRLNHPLGGMLTDSNGSGCASPGRPLSEALQKSRDLSSRPHLS